MEAQLSVRLLRVFLILWDEGWTSFGYLNYDKKGAYVLSKYKLVISLT